MTTLNLKSLKGKMTPSLEHEVTCFPSITRSIMSLDTYQWLIKHAICYTQALYQSYLAYKLNPRPLIITHLSLAYNKSNQVKPNIIFLNILS